MSCRLKKLLKNGNSFNNNYIITEIAEIDIKIHVPAFVTNI